MVLTGSHHRHYHVAAVIDAVGAFDQGIRPRHSTKIFGKPITGNRLQPLQRLQRLQR
jgi:hypothetical protein